MSPHDESIRRHAMAAAIEAWLCVITDAAQEQETPRAARRNPDRYLQDTPAPPPPVWKPQGLPWDEC